MIQGKHKNNFSYKKLFIVLAFVLVYTHPLYAYLDPGTGSMLLAALLGIASAILFSLKTIWYKLHTSIFRLFRLKTKIKDKPAFVFYCEGRQYWFCFKPIIDVLIDKKISFEYLTSDEQDPGLSYLSRSIDTNVPVCYTARYIGTGNKAFTYLNLLEAEVCVLTTPGLDVLQIRRSKGVKQYVHVMHAPTDIHLYKVFSFDFYDTVMVSGVHQERSLRKIESKRKLTQKRIINVGCTYMDELVKKKRELSFEFPEEKNTILVAPTWGDVSFVNCYGSAPLRMLLEEGYRIILRLHPQSYISEKHMIEQLKSDLQTFDTIEWDTNADNFPALSRSSLMISDRSGIIFDYAFVFEKPIVISDASSYDYLGMEGRDCDWPSWEQTHFSEIAYNVKPEHIHELPLHVKRLLSRYQEKSVILSLRDSSLYNFGHAGIVAANTLIKLQGDI